jgi:carboxypeptidase Taq
MMHEKMQQDIPGMESLIEQGDFRKIREWLNTNVHQYGKRFTGPDLIEHITGHELSVAPFVSYVRKKFPNAA